jgi:perosamine synthetase
MNRIGEKERQYVLEALNSQFRSSAGSVMTGRLEALFAKKFGVRYAIAHVNGTATMHSALAAVGIGPGDEVIVPPLTMSSTAFAVLHANAVPVFADIDPETFTIAPSDIRRKVTARTKAIIPVSLYGLSADMDEIMNIARQHNLIVVEDDAECLMGYYKGKIVGSIGHMASFSFQSSKHITSGEGGMIITDDRELADKVRKFNSLGYAGVSAGKGKITKEDIQDPEYERHVCLGFNYRMPEICSAVALAQLERMEELVQKRLESAGLYAEAVKGCNWLIPQMTPPDYKHSYWTYVLKLADDVSFTWYDFRKKYIEFGGDGFYAAWQLTYLEPVFKNYVFYKQGCPVRCPYYQGKPQEYGPGLCPAAESVQPRLMQFKTNYLDADVAARKADALSQTIRYFDSL